MKKLLFFCLCIIAGNGYVQAQEAANLPRLQERAQAFVGRNGDTTFQKLLQGTLVVPGNRVIALPQDGMPCIVPDTKEIAAMPNAMLHYPQPAAGQIPNAWKSKEPLKNSVISK